MAPEAVKWESLKGIAKEEYVERLQNKEFDAHLKNPDFRKAVSDGTLFEKPAITPTEQPAEKVVLEAPAAAAPKIEPKGTPFDPIWKRRGYDSEDALEKAIGDLEVTKLEKERLAKEAAENKIRVDRLNADRGRDGLAIKKQMDTVAAENEKMRKELEALKAEATRASVKVNIPKIPTIEEADFTSEEKRLQYNQSMDGFNKQIADSFESINKKNAELEAMVRATSSKTENLVAFSQDVAQDRQAKMANQALDDIFAEAVKLQGKYPELKTDCSLSDINDSTVKIRKGELTVEEFHKKYKPEDVGKYEKLVGYIRSYRDFDENGNIVLDSPKRVRNLETLYIDDVVDSGQLQNLLNRVKVEAGTQARGEVLDQIERINDTAVGLPAGGELRDIPKVDTGEEELRKLNDLATEGLLVIEKDPAKVKEYMRLATKYKAGIPQSWRTKYGT